MTRESGNDRPCPFLANVVPDRLDQTTTGPRGETGASTAPAGSRAAGEGKRGGWVCDVRNVSRTSTRFPPGRRAMNGGRAVRADPNFGCLSGGQLSTGRGSRWNLAGPPGKGRDGIGMSSPAEEGEGRKKEEEGHRNPFSPPSRASQVRSLLVCYRKGLARVRKNRAQSWRIRSRCGRHNQTKMPIPAAVKASG